MSGISWTLSAKATGVGALLGLMACSSAEKLDAAPDHDASSARDGGTGGVFGTDASFANGGQAPDAMDGDAAPTTPGGMDSGTPVADAAGVRDATIPMDAADPDPDPPPADSSAPVGDAGVRDATIPLDAADSDPDPPLPPPDSGIPEDGGFHIAKHPAPPQIVYRGGPVLTNPKLISISYDDYALRAVVDDMLAKMRTTGEPYWTAATRDYGIGLPSSQAIHLSGASPSVIDDLQIQDFLSSRLDGTHAEYGTPADNPIYVFYFPSTTSVTHATLVGCTSFYGYHSQLTLPSGPYAGQKVAYAVIPECTAGLGAEYNTTTATSHEVIESVTDPFGTATGGTGWYGVDDDHLVWEIRGGEGEVGDLCEGIYGSNIIPFPFPYLVQRIWSNSAALAGENPCAPPLFGGWPYFNAVPVLTDTATIKSKGASQTTKGVLIPFGESKTIEVVLFSNQPTGPWNVSATDLSPLFGPGPRLTFSWDSTTGQNGTKLHLTITALSGTTQFGGSPFMITSSDGIQHHEWLGYVAQN